MIIPPGCSVSIHGNTWRSGDDCPDHLVPESLKAYAEKVAKKGKAKPKAKVAGEDQPK